MAKNSIDAYGAAGKTNLLMFDPEKLVLVTNVSSPLYDPRVTLPVSESLVRNIMAVGVLQPVLVCKNAETGETEVVAGRQRVKAAREANKRLVAQGCEPIQVPAVTRRASSGADQLGVLVSENELREADTPLGRAEKMRRLMDLGRSEDQLAVTFGCTTQTVRNTLALLDCTATVRNAVEAGKINVGHALKLSKLEPVEQREKLAELVTAGETAATPRERAKAQRAVVQAPDAPPKMRSRREIEQALLTVRNATVATTLAWAMGQTAELPL